MNFHPTSQQMRGLEHFLQSELAPHSVNLKRRLCALGVKSGIRVAQIHLQSAGHCEYDAASRAATIFIDPCREDEREFLRDLVVPHELAHALQMAVDGCQLVNETPKDLQKYTDLLTHPRVYELLIDCGACPKFLSAAHDARVESTTQWDCPDGIWSWVNSALASMRLDDVKQLFASRVRHGSDHTSFLALWKGISLAQKEFRCRRSATRPLLDVARVWQDEVKPAVQRGAFHR